MRTTEAVIFDYYETLAQLQRPLREAMFDGIALEAGYEAEPGQVYQEWVELARSDFALDARPAVDGAPPRFRSFWDVWEERFGELFRGWGVDAEGRLGADAYTRLHANAVVYPEIEDTLAELSRRCRLAVLSNADDGFLRASLAKNGLEFATVVSSEEVRAYKPHVSIFHETCERMGVDPADALYVGDQPWADIEGSRNAGMGQAWVNRHGAAWPDDVGPPQHTVASLSGLLALVG